MTCPSGQGRSDALGESESKLVRTCTMKKDVKERRIEEREAGRTTDESSQLESKKRCQNGSKARPKWHGAVVGQRELLL